MLQRLNLLTLFILATILFAGCSKDQTSMSIEDIQGKAKIMGHLSYVSEQTYQNGMFGERTKPVANTEVYVKIENSHLSSNGQAQGYTTYTTTTDSKGDYTIEIPVVELGENIRIQGQAFIGECFLIKQIEKDKAIFETKNGLFSCPNVEHSVMPNVIIIADIQYTFEARV